MTITTTSTDPMGKKNMDIVVLPESDYNNKYGLVMQVFGGSTNGYSRSRNSGQKNGPVTSAHPLKSSQIKERIL